MEACFWSWLCRLKERFISGSGSLASGCLSIWPWSYLSFNTTQVLGVSLCQIQNKWESHNTPKPSTRTSWLREWAWILKPWADGMITYESWRYPRTDGFLELKGAVSAQHHLLSWQCTGALGAVPGTSTVLNVSCICSLVICILCSNLFWFFLKTK